MGVVCYDPRLLRTIATSATAIKNLQRILLYLDMVRLENGICPWNIKWCCPSRVTILTHRYNCDVPPRHVDPSYPIPWATTAL